jgi:hypothetical protein
MQGEKVVAAEMVSRFNDRFHGQWLMLFVPFRRVTDFDHASLEMLPQQHRQFGRAMLCPHPAARAMWDDRAAIRREMQVEAHTSHHIDTVLGMIAAQRPLIEEYAAGRLDAAQEERERQERVLRHAEQRDAVVEDWNGQQRALIGAVTSHIDRAFAAQYGDDEDRADALRTELERDGRVHVCFGPPATGKTTAIFHCIDRALNAGGRVLFALPTAQLASRMREKWGDAIDIYTCAAAFGFMEHLNAPGQSLSMYSLVVVDEISQLQGWQSDHIIKLWRAAEQIPALVLVGDKWQIAGFGDVRAWHTSLWKKEYTGHRAARGVPLHGPNISQGLRCVEDLGARLRHDEAVDAADGVAI